MAEKTENSAPRRPSFYLPPDIYEEVKEQADKYGLSVSKCIQDAWAIARCSNSPLPDGVALFRDGPIEETEEEMQQ